MWKNVLQPGRPQMAIWGMRVPGWITKATNTHSEYVTTITFHFNNGYMNGPQCYVISTLPVIFFSVDVFVHI
jgi:hypothetical protein